MNRLFNLLSFLVYDIIVSAISILLSFYFLNEEMAITWINPFTFTLIVWPFVTIFSLYLINVYKILWRFSGMNEIFRVFFGGFASALATIIAQKAVFPKFDVNISVYILTYFFTMFFIIIQDAFCRIPDCASCRFRAREAPWDTRFFRIRH